MGRKHFLLTLALALAAGFAGQALYGALVSPRAAQARAASADPGDGQWEYCAVLKAQYPGSVRLIYWIAYFRGEEVKIENVETGVGGSPFAKAAAKLGQDGWEMVGAGPLEVRLEARPGTNAGLPNAIFFKRRKD
jgi:hypothetical protein